MIKPWRASIGRLCNAGVCLNMDTIMKEKLLERLLRYTRINTPSCEEAETTPSSSCQYDLAKELAEEMTALGIIDVRVDEHCYVYGFLPASEGCEGKPAIGLIAHMDTVSDFCDGPVTPVVHENYDGGDIVLTSAGRTITVRDFPHLAKMAGRTIITSDGTTILGADDKAGIAEIMTLAEILLKKNVLHGKICIAFTPDEEIGSGAALLNLAAFGADYAYTLDGDLEGSIEYETFNAASATVDISGVNVHPGSATGIMVNAAVVGCEFQNALPENEQPRTTSGYEGFYHLTSFEGTVGKAQLNYIIRDHDRKKFEERKRLFLEIGKQLNRKYGKDCVRVTLEDSYYNMADVLKDHMELIDQAAEAAWKAGIEPVITPVRGGTDGACLSFRGLPCPNIGTGGAAFHGPYEHISLEGMERVVQMMKNIVTGV